MPKFNWFLLRGLARYSDHWAPFEQELIRAIPESSIYYLNTLGNGPKHQLTSPTTIQKYTHDLRDDYKKIQIQDNGKKILVAISLGGMIALDWASRFQDFEHVVIINTSVANIGNPLDRFSPTAFATLFKILRKPKDLFNQEKEILKLVTNKEVTDELVQWHVQLQKKYPTNLRNFARQMIAASTFKCPSKVSVPITFIVSDKDRLVSKKFSYQLAQKFNAPIYSHPEAGHDLGVDDPKWLAQTLRAHFLTHSQ